MISLACVLAFGALSIAASIAWQRRRARPRQSGPLPLSRRLLVHTINDDRCTGCDACVTVCPTDVLELVDNKSRVARFDDCIQCEQCALVCPTTALVMHEQGTRPPPIRLPVLDEHYQAAPGLYLIGEAAGKPLVKNAVNLGRAVVEHMATARRAAQGELDVVIVGSGPGGLSAALSAAALGLRYAVLEKDDLVAATIARWPAGKECMAEPYDVRALGLLPVWDAGRDELLAKWRQVIDKAGVRVRTRETVEAIVRRGDAFDVRTNRGGLRAAQVVLSIGTRGKPRRLGVAGEELPHVFPLLDDPSRHRGRRALVVGGGDSAVEAALALVGHATRVVIAYRGKALSRCKAKNRQRLDDAVAAGKIQLRFSTQVRRIDADSVTVEERGQTATVGADSVFVCIGGDAPIAWLEAAGARFADHPHDFTRPPTDALVDRLLRYRRVA